MRAIGNLYLTETDDEKILYVSGIGRVRKDPADFPTWNGPVPTGLTLTEGTFTPE